MRKLLVILLCLTSAMLGHAQQYTYRYWFDEAKTFNVANGASAQDFNVETGSLADGIHALHVFVTDANGVASATQTQFFVKHSAPKGKLRYWFDGVMGNGGELSSTSTTVQIDASKLPEGIHTLHVQTDGDNPSAIQTAYFTKLPMKGSLDNLTCVTIIDGKVAGTQKVSNNNGSADLLLNLDTLSEGTHSIAIELLTSEGIASAIQTAYFVKLPRKGCLDNLTCVTIIDGKVTGSQKVSNDNGSVELLLNVDTLSEGIHSIAVELLTAEGMASAIQSAFFMKMANGDGRICAYEYWVNDDFENKIKEDVKEATDPYQLEAMLPMPKQPFRSTSFMFENKDDKPAVYGKNTLNMRFYETSGRVVECSKEYGDYSSRQEIQDVETLISAKPVTVTKPGENEIRWYSFFAKPTDSLRLQVNKACTVQVFSPAGKEVYCNNGATQWGAFNADERGTYYVALHDVTASVETFKLSYERIQKIFEAEYITLNQTDLMLRLGGTNTLKAKVLPENTTDKTVTWTSANDSVASVTSEGLLPPSVWARP